MAEMKDLYVDTGKHGLTTVALGDLGVSDGYHGQLSSNHSDTDASDGEIFPEVGHTNLMFHNELDSEQQTELRENNLHVSEPVVSDILLYLLYFTSSILICIFFSIRHIHILNPSF